MAEARRRHEETLQGRRNELRQKAKAQHQVRPFSAVAHAAPAEAPRTRQARSLAQTVLQSVVEDTAQVEERMGELHDQLGASGCGKEAPRPR